MKALLSVLQRSPIVNTSTWHFKPCQVFHLCWWSFREWALSWSQEVIGTAWHPGCFGTLWSDAVYFSEVPFLSALWINEKSCCILSLQGEKPWVYKSLSRSLLQSPLGATVYVFTWQIIRVSSLGVSSETISQTKETEKCWCSMKDGVFISGSASLSQSLPHTAIHYLSVGQGKLSWGPIVFSVEFWLCV